MNLKFPDTSPALGHKWSHINNNFTQQFSVPHSKFIFQEKVPLNICEVNQGGSNELINKSVRSFLTSPRPCCHLHHKGQFLPDPLASESQAASLQGEEAHWQGPLSLWPRVLCLTIRAAPVLKDKLRATWLPFLLNVFIYSSRRTRSNVINRF